MVVMLHLYPLHILVASLAGLLNRRQAEVFECLVEENSVPRKHSMVVVYD
ncbi:MAG: hypothetical protein ACI841_004111 [Planctomycetota bacterium]|jgi:hypothetical protein